MQLSIISGSHRPISQSAKVARYIHRRLEQLVGAAQPQPIELGANPLPLWEETAGSDPAWQTRLQPIQTELRESDGFVVVSPEWHGMVPAALKNFFLLWTSGELAHKPALIVTLSAVDGGAYPVAELRMSSYKNNRICYLPEHLIIRNVEQVFNEKPADNVASAHDYFDARLNYCLKLLEQYALALRQVRASGAGSLETFANGM